MSDLLVGVWIWLTGTSPSESSGSSSVRVSSGTSSVFEEGFVSGGLTSGPSDTRPRTSGVLYSGAAGDSATVASCDFTSDGGTTRP